MMHAFLFIGATANIRQQKIQARISDWNISPFDVITLTLHEEHITIDDVRTFKRRLMLTPMKSDYTIGSMYQAKSMTTEAQNALLKLLEEPPAHVRIMLETDTTDMLLPTIVSRCQVVHVSGNNEVHAQTPLQELMDASIGEKLALLDAYTHDRIQAKTFAEEALRTGEAMLHTHTDLSKIAALLRRLMTAQTQLSVNCNPRLVLDRAFFF